MSNVAALQSIKEQAESNSRRYLDAERAVSDLRSATRLMHFVLNMRFDQMDGGECRAEDVWDLCWLSGVIKKMADDMHGKLYRDEA